MKINHINLTVSDVPAAAQFLETYFGLRDLGGRGGFAALMDDDHMVVTLMKAREVKYPPTFHIGFGQESEERVNEIHQRLQADGFDVTQPERAHAWTFYVQAPGGFTVEVMA